MNEIINTISHLFADHLGEFIVAIVLGIWRHIEIPVIKKKITAALRAEIEAELRAENKEHLPKNEPHDKV